MAAVVEYIPGNSLVHRLNALTKMSWAGFIMVAAVIFSDYRCLLALLASVLAVAAAAGIIKNIMPAMRALTIFALVLFLIQALFYGQGQTLFHLIPPGGRLPVTDLGVLSGVAMAARMLTIVLSFMVILVTTRTQDIILALVERCRLPYDYAFMFLTALRFIPTFLGEVRQVSQAQQARGLAVDGINPVKKIRAYAPVTVPLVLVSLNKAEQLAMAMETRGFGSGPRTYFRESRLHTIDYCLMAVLVILLAAAAVMRILGYGVL